MELKVEKYKCAICGNEFNFDEFTAHCRIHFGDDLVLKTKLFALAKRVSYPIKCRFVNCKNLVLFNQIKPQNKYDICDNCLIESKYKHWKPKEEISNEEYERLRKELIDEANSLVWK